MKVNCAFLLVAISIVALTMIAAAVLGQQRQGIPGTVLPGDFAVTAVMRPGETRITAPAGRIKLETDELSGVTTIIINTKAPGR